jgi:hypothetical protein
MTFGRCRSCSGTRMSARRWCTRTCSVAVLSACAVPSTELAELEATSALPEAPAEARVEEWVLDAYRWSWTAEDLADKSDRA